MTQIVGEVNVYDVAPAPGGQVRLEMSVRAASFPDFAVVFDAEVAKRVGLALLANAEYQLARKYADQGIGGAVNAG